MSLLRTNRTEAAPDAAQKTSDSSKGPRIDDISDEEPVSAQAAGQEGSAATAAVGDDDGRRSPDVSQASGPGLPRTPAFSDVSSSSKPPTPAYDVIGTFMGAPAVAPVAAEFATSTPDGSMDAGECTLESPPSAEDKTLQMDSQPCTTSLEFPRSLTTESAGLTQSFCAKARASDQVLQSSGSGSSSQQAGNGRVCGVASVQEEDDESGIVAEINRVPGSGSHVQEHPQKDSCTDDDALTSCHSPVNALTHAESPSVSSDSSHCTPEVQWEESDDDLDATIAAAAAAAVVEGKNRIPKDMHEQAASDFAETQVCDTQPSSLSDPSTPVDADEETGAPNDIRVAQNLALTASPVKAEQTDSETGAPAKFARAVECTSEPILFDATPAMLEKPQGQAGIPSEAQAETSMGPEMLAHDDEELYIEAEKRWTLLQHVSLAPWLYYT